MLKHFPDLLSLAFALTPAAVTLETRTAVAVTPPARQ